jgi:hypothetical protein
MGRAVKGDMVVVPFVRQEGKMPGGQSARLSAPLGADAQLPSVRPCAQGCTTLVTAMTEWGARNEGAPIL